MYSIKLCKVRLQKVSHPIFVPLKIMFRISVFVTFFVYILLCILPFLELLLDHIFVFFFPSTISNYCVDLDYLLGCEVQEGEIGINRHKSDRQTNVFYM